MAWRDEQMDPFFCAFSSLLDDPSVSYSHKWAEGDVVIIDNLAVAHKAAPGAHTLDSGLRILHRTTIKAMINFDPPFGLPAQANMHGANPLGQGVWQGGGLGFRWDETIPMQN